MKLTSRVGIALVAFGALAVGAGAVQAQSFGCYAMPSRFTQYLGYGYGAGHHVPIARTPGVHPERVPRYTRVSAGCGPLYGASYEPVGCYGETCYQTPAAAPAMAPAPMPMPEPMPAAEMRPAPTAAPPPERQAWQFISP